MWEKETIAISAENPEKHSRHLVYTNNDQQIEVFSYENSDSHRISFIAGSEARLTEIKAAFGKELDYHQNDLMKEKHVISFCSHDKLFLAFLLNKYSSLDSDFKKRHLDDLSRDLSLDLGEAYSNFPEWIAQGSLVKQEYLNYINTRNSPIKSLYIERVHGEYKVWIDLRTSEARRKLVQALNDKKYWPFFVTYNVSFRNYNIDLIFDFIKVTENTLETQSPLLMEIQKIINTNKSAPTRALLTTPVSSSIEFSHQGL